MSKAQVRVAIDWVAERRDALPARERVLVVDDDPVLRDTLAGLLSATYEVSCARGGTDAIAHLQRHDVDLIITDLMMPEGNGEELLQVVRRTFPAVPVIVMTSFGSIENAVSMMHYGAAEYLPKPLQHRTLLDAVARVLEQSRVHRARVRASRRSEQPDGLIGVSPPMKHLFRQINRVAPSTVPVLISGETGTGKELVAAAIHEASGRAPFVPINCSALPAGLLESELFGHVRGAFTGAERDKVGLFEMADGGTLFLDEIAELPLALQAKLLRAIQSGEFRRVGDVAARHSAARVIAASHRDLAAAAHNGSFRGDLYYRINVLRLHVPALRERTLDIPLLADHFLAEFATRERTPLKRLSNAAQAYLVTFPWPGNVRQLRNYIERLAVLCDHETIDIDDLPDEVLGEESRTTAQRQLGSELPLADLEREHVLAVLKRCGGNRTQAAQILGVPRRTLYRRLREYGVLTQE